MNDITPEPSPTYLQLRSLLFSLNPADAGLTPSDAAPHVWGVMMETGYAVGFATLVSLADGTTSLYYSTGGGMLGSADYTPVADASKAFVTQAENHLQHMSSSDELSLPDVGQVRFIFLTYTGIYTTEESEETLASGNHPLSRLYKLGRETMAQLRILAEKTRK